MDAATSVMPDPDWAWEPYSPAESQPWNQKLAAHLFRRSGFAPTASELRRAVDDGCDSTIRRLTQTDRNDAGFRSEINVLARAAVASGSMKQLAAGWVYRMLMTPDPLLEKTTLFWHGHFATSAAKVDDVKLMQQQNDLLREHALGDFQKLVQEISRDPAMLIYLDSASNRKSHPNENYAREIMELFCLGEGNYSENDIRELARCFTGWEIKREKFRFNRYQHDNGEKSILGQTGRFGGEEGVKIVCDQENAPLFICEKLVRYFVADDFPVDSVLLRPLADQLRAEEMQIGPTVRRILQSNVFYSEYAIARKIRSPVEFALDFLRSLECTTDTYLIADAISDLGQGLYYPPSVKGWDGGRAWINSSTLVGRSNLIRRILDHEKTRFGKKSLSEYLADQSVSDVDGLIDLLEPMLFATPLSTAARQRVHSIGNSNGSSNSAAFADVVHLLCSLPEYQLS